MRLIDDLPIGGLKGKVAARADQPACVGDVLISRQGEGAFSRDFAIAVG